MEGQARLEEGSLAVKGLRGLAIEREARGEEFRPGLKAVDGYIAAEHGAVIEPRVRGLLVVRCWKVRGDLER